MSFQLRTVDRSKISDSIVDQILEGIASGAFPPGTVLPPERALADQLGVSRGSVREAIRVLEYAGILDVRTGSGTYIAQAGVSKATALRVQAALVGEQSPLDVIVTRRALEPDCAELAASNRTEHDLEILRGLIEEQRRLVELAADPAEVDLAFHVAVAAAGHNPVLVSFMDRLADLMHQATWRELKHRSRERPGNNRMFLRQHEEILNAIAGGDSGRASRVMLVHLDAVEGGLLAEVEEERESADSR